MRVISGSARSLALKTPDGMGTRPTTDRIKETLFNMIQHELCDCNFLDLFAGSGAIGIEALSRGACKAVFVEKNKAAIKCISDNLKYTKLTDRSVIKEQDVFTALATMDPKSVFDFVFMDPPYDQLLEKQVLWELRDKSYIDDNTIIIIEASKNTSFDYLEEFGFRLIKRKEYKTNTHVFVVREKENGNS